MQRAGWLVGLIVWAVGCRPGDFLTVPPPTNVVAVAAVSDAAGANALYAQGRTDFFGALGFDEQLLAMEGMFTDELAATDGGYLASIDARKVVPTALGVYEYADTPLETMLAARIALLNARGPLRQYGGSTGLTDIGAAYALVGYVEVFVAEDYCAGMPLSSVTFGGGISFGTVPYTTDSLLGVAETDFDSALANANGDASVQSLASVGLGRALLDRGQYAAAAAAVGNVPTSFVYAMQYATQYAAQGVQYNFIYAQTSSVYSCGEWQVADREGGNGLNFVSANDPRLVLDSTRAETCNGRYYGAPDSVFYYPVKFGSPSTQIPLATGVEARLIEAEAALQANQPATWTADLNALRTDGSFTVDTLPGPVIDTVWGLGTGQVSGQTVGLRPLTDPGASAAEQDLMFRERAFWLFGTGTRLGDLRRLIRQYNRGAETVFPTGTYEPNLQTSPAWLQAQGTYPMTTYGTDVSFTLPTKAGNAQDANPYYKGCLTSTTTA